MALFSGRKRTEVTEVADPNPGTREDMPARPYRVLYADLEFCSDPECKMRVKDARLIVLRSEDPKQQHQIQECMPTRKKYQPGQLVEWDLNNKQIWQESWYRNPETGKAEKTWTQAVEFIGRVVQNKSAY
jgi:hypothetical protein